MTAPLTKMLLLAIAVFALNIPFGYWREGTRKFSLPSVLAIHLPVPIVIALRYYSGLGFQLHSYPVLIGAFFLGQYVGVRLRRRMMTRWEGSTSGCLVMDMWRNRAGR
ncbi:MAG: hypothetical protein M5R41_18535 [Bacteroidia bacterium]|nr:hypothetical protein [Bacteroidia bacterium]